MPAPQFYYQQKVPGRLQLFWRAYRKNLMAYFSMWLLLSLVVIGILAPLIAPWDPATQFENQNLPPSWYPGGMNQFIFGTDDLGRDIFSRLLFGARLSLSLAFVVVVIAAGIGISLGVLSGFTRFWLDALILRFLDLLLALPSLLLAIVIVAVIGPGLPNAIYAVALVLIPHFALITRSAIREEMAKEHVVASRLDGAKGFYLFRTEILPNILPPIIVQSTFAFSTAILEIAALGFLGLGAQPPNPEWGTLLSESHDFILTSPWAVALPGLAIFFTILSVNKIGDGLNDAFNQERGKA